MVHGEEEKGRKDKGAYGRGRMVQKTEYVQSELRQTLRRLSLIHI